MSLPKRFTYPFCYTPHPMVRARARKIIARISSDPALAEKFAEGKMLGALLAIAPGGEKIWLDAFSGNVGGCSHIEGFVPPVFDLLEPDGHYKRTEAEISELNRRIAASDPDSAALKALRKRMSIELQDWIFEQYKVLNARGECLSIKEVFARQGLVAPGGTGDCAAPKLLQEAYRRGLRPVMMGEFWYGASPQKEVRHQGCFYPSCMGKCGPLLPFMLEGLSVMPNPLEKSGPAASYSIIFEDDAIVVVDKPSGALSVPGRGAAVSVQELLQKRLGAPVFACHRLDMDTAGVIVYAKTDEAYREIQRQFASREVKKTYIARLSNRDGAPSVPESGEIDLPLFPDYYDRPRQMVDFEAGKPAKTLYQRLSVNPDGTVDVRFTPLTGRTHQLRVHAAHPLGLNRPILGDRLYGYSNNKLFLIAESLTIFHPISGKSRTYTSRIGFSDLK